MSEGLATPTEIFIACVIGYLNSDLTLSTSNSIGKSKPDGPLHPDLHPGPDHFRLDQGHDPSRLILIIGQPMKELLLEKPILKKWNINTPEIPYLIHPNIPQLHLSAWTRMTCEGSTPHYL